METSCVPFFSVAVCCNVLFGVLLGDPGGERLEVAQAPLDQLAPRLALEDLEALGVDVEALFDE